MSKVWGQPKGAKKDEPEVGGAPTPEKLQHQGARDPAGDYVGAVTRSDEGSGEGTEAPPAPKQDEAPAPAPAPKPAASKAGRR